MSNKETKEMLEEAIVSEIQDLSTLQAGSEEKSRAIEDLARLYKLMIEETKNELDFNEKVIGYECDERLKREQLAEQVKDRYFKLGAEAVGIILPLIFYSAWMKRGFKFEETGTYTSTTFRGLFSRFRPAK